jgi:hypothetical protein
MKSQLAKKILSAVTVCCLLLCLTEFLFPVRFLSLPDKKVEISKILQEIYEEVKVFDRYPGCDFIKREFFVGEDDDDTNKDIHVVILVQDVDAKDKVTIQVTYMERSKGRPVVGIAKYVKVLSFYVQEDRVEIIQSDFDREEKQIVFLGILRAIRDKKKLLNKI